MQYSNLPVSDLHTLFGKPELIACCEELKLDTTGTTRDLIARLYMDMYTNGLPANEDCSDSLYSFMVEARFIDEDGTELEIPELDMSEEEVNERKPAGIVETIDGDPSNAPRCYGYADNRDPACRRCKLLDTCTVKRISIRPPCFGKEFSTVAEECLVCIEAYNCKVAFEDAKRILSKN